MAFTGELERADAFVEMSDLEVGQDGKVVRDVEPAVALQAGIGLIRGWSSGYR